MTEEELENEKKLFMWKKQQKDKSLTEWILAACLAIFSTVVILQAVSLISQIINN